MSGFRPSLPGRAAPGAAVVIGLGAVAVALYTQHVWDMQPCPWCVLQRLFFLAIAVAALPALLLRTRATQLLSGTLMLLLAMCGIGAALWQHFVAAATNACRLTLADRIVGGLGLDTLWPQVFAAYATCAEASVRIFGVPYAFCSALLFAVLAALAAVLLRRPRRR